MEREELIKLYLADRSKLYQDWLAEIDKVEADSEVVLYSSRTDKSPDEEGTKRFKRYFEVNQKVIQRKVCRKYLQIREESTNVGIIIAAVSDALGTGGYATATILVTERYLDKLCVKQYE
ncbi:hypothetical protein QUF74_16800 [Candidatus Halobeggiatoa sp. HSG11]|nr:hypothetical protein [Candidatus Halobeggiatoa sp. HSG11]